MLNRPVPTGELQDRDSKQLRSDAFTLIQDAWRLGRVAEVEKPSKLKRTAAKHGEEQRCKRLKWKDSMQT